MGMCVFDVRIGDPGISLGYCSTRLEATDGRNPAHFEVGS